MKVLLTATVQSHICQFHKPLVEVLHKHGCEVHVAARDNLAEKNGLKLDFVEKVYDIPFARSPKSKDNIQAYKELKHIINNENYDVIHCNTPMGGIVTRLAAKQVRKQGTKVYYTAHGFHFYKGAPKKNWIVFYPIEKYFSRMTDKLITITKEDYHLASQKFHCKVERIHGVGVDENRYHSVLQEEQMEIRKQFGFTDGQKIILCVGELLPNKNQQMIIHAMQKIVKKYPDAQLLLAGNGSEKENLENLIKSLRLTENIKMLGYVTNLQEYQKIADVSVSCSKREGLPLNIVEAMLSGTPVVASVNRGHRELIQNGKNGFLIDLVYASSSSVYGTNKKIPYSTDDKVDNPVSLYAATKKSNELMAHAYSKLYNIPSTGLRFFTVYGPAGRPDMAYFGFTNKLCEGSKIQIFNYGNCKRDFTYVDDIVEGVKRVMQSAPEKKIGEDGLPVPPYAVYNIGNNRPENLLDFVDILQQELIRAEVLPEDYRFDDHKELVAMQPGDVPITYADTTALERDFGFKPSTSLREGLRKFAEWYKKFYIK